MDNLKLALVFAAQTAFFVFFNFTLEDVGTIFLILAVLNGLLAVYFYRKYSSDNQ